MYRNAPTIGVYAGRSPDKGKRAMFMPMMGYGYSWGGVLLALLLFTGLGVLIWALVRLTGHTPGSGFPLTGRTGHTAIEILRQRYAHGEIDTATFEQMRRRLEGTRTGEPLGT
jgi:uncharacterized membrane protein